MNPQKAADEIKLACQRRALLSFPIVSPRESVCDVADYLLRLDIKEPKGKNDGIPQFLFCDGELLPWCAAFVDFCFRVAGYPLPGNKWANRAVQKLLAETTIVHGFSLNACDAGDVAFFRGRPGSDPMDSTTVHHCGIVVQTSQHAIETIEGNSGNGIARRRYDRTSPAIYGFGRFLK